MRYRSRYRYRSPARRLAGIVFLVFLFIAVFAGGSGGFLLPIFFVGLAFASLIGSFATLSPRGVYGGLQGFIWMLGLALCFAVGFWPWILIPIILSALLGILLRPIMALLLGIGIFGVANMMNQQRPMYQQPYQPYQPPQQQEPYQDYGQGYQPVPQPPPETYREGGQQYQYPQQSYDQPQAQYPQELPPQQ